MTPLNILFEDNQVIAVFKVHGQLTQGDASQSSSLLDETKQWLKEKYHKPGNAFLGMVHRLDRPCSGLVIFAKTSKAASRLSSQIRLREVRKIYRAQIMGPRPAPEGGFSDYIVSESESRVRVLPRPAPGSKMAVLSYRLLASRGDIHTLEVDLETGRKHQIRAQFGARGWPILGDVKYGSTVKYTGGIALLAYQYSFQHPTTRMPITITVPENLSPLAVPCKLH